MGLLHRRFAWYGRPVPFALGALVASLGLFFGLGWRWQWSLQTGNVFLLVTFPRTIVAVDPGHLMLLGIGLVGLLVAARIGLQNEDRARRQVTGPHARSRRPSFRFYPFTLAFGLFLAYFGTTFLFDASVYGDSPPEGFAAFLYFDYAGLLDRPFMTAVGALVLGFGLTCATSLAFERGHGLGFPTVLRTVSFPRAPSAGVHTAGPETTPRLPRPLVTRTARDVLPPARRAAAPIPGFKTASAHEDLEQVGLRQDPERLPSLRDEDRRRIL